MPKFSVIIPTYNEARYLGQALESVLAQTFQDFEIIVVDDGSTDNTREIAESFGPRVQYIHQKNQGAHTARNAGIRLAQGEFLAFLDSDDVWYPDKLKRQNRYLEEHPEADMAHGYLDAMDEAGHLLEPETAQGRRLFRRLNQKGISYESVISDCAFHFDTCVLRRSRLPALGTFQEAIPVCEDFDFLLRAAAFLKIGFLEGPSLAAFRIHGNGFGFKVFNEGRIDVLKRHLALIQSGAFPVNRRRAERNLRLSLSSCHFVLGNKTEGRKRFLAAVRRDPSALFTGSYARVFLFSFLHGGIKKCWRRLMSQASRQTV